MKTTCPNCQSFHDSNTGVTGATEPENNDISVCADCGQVSRYDTSAEGNLVLLTPEELIAVCAEVPELAYIVQNHYKIWPGH